MKLDQLSYRKRNKLLLLAALLLLLACWWLSFSKAFSAYRTNRELRTRVAVSDATGKGQDGLGVKYGKLDSLVDKYTMDSLAFANSFLTTVSLAIEGLPIQLYYEGNTTTYTEAPLSISQEVTLEGGYKAIVEAVQRLEEFFMVQGIVYNETKCKIRLSAVQRKRI